MVLPWFWKEHASWKLSATAEISKHNSLSVYGEHRLQRGGCCRSEVRCIARKFGKRHTVPVWLKPAIPCLCGCPLDSFCRRFTRVWQFEKTHLTPMFPRIHAGFSVEKPFFSPHWDIKQTDFGKELAFLLFSSLPLNAAQTTWYEALKMFWYTVVLLASVQAVEVAATHRRTGWDARVKAVLLHGCSGSQPLAPCLYRKHRLCKSSPCRLQDLSVVCLQPC